MLNHQPARSWSDQDEELLRAAMQPHSTLPRMMTVREDDFAEAIKSCDSLRQKTIDVLASRDCWRALAVTMGGLFVTLAVAYVWTLLRIAE